MAELRPLATGLKCDDALDLPSCISSHLRRWLTTPRLSPSPYGTRGVASAYPERVILAVDGWTGEDPSAPPPVRRVAQ